MKYELTTTPHPKTLYETNIYFARYTIKPKTSQIQRQLKIFQNQQRCSIINVLLRKHTTLCSHTAKFSNKNLSRYYVSERSRNGAKQKRGNGPHWRRRQADARIIWRKYYEARRYSRYARRTGGARVGEPSERLITHWPIRQRLANYVLMAD